VRDKGMIWVAFPTWKLRNKSYVLLRFHCQPFRLEHSNVWTMMMGKGRKIKTNDEEAGRNMRKEV
jgi:hypothetical protein